MLYAILEAVIAFHVYMMRFGVLGVFMIERQVCKVPSSAVSLGRSTGYIDYYRQNTKYIFDE
jgi:hypothetical protein